MLTYISILRGINVSGQKKIKMSDLKSLYEELGFSFVQTYIQSGNIVFRYKKINVHLLEKIIFDKIKSYYDFEVPNLVLQPNEISIALANNPFKEKERTYFVFLKDKPNQTNIDELNKLDFSPEQYYIDNKIVYLLPPPAGYGRTKMNNNFFEKKLEVIATTRNYKTTKKLLEMSNS